LTLPVATAATREVECERVDAEASVAAHATAIAVASAASMVNLFIPLPPDRFAADTGYDVFAGYSFAS